MLSINHQWIDIISNSRIFKNIVEYNDSMISFKYNPVVPSIMEAVDHWDLVTFTKQTTR